MDIGQGTFKFKPRRGKLHIEDTINGTSILDVIRKIAHGQHTQAEAAAYLGCSRQVFNEFLNGHEEAMDAWREGRLTGKASLRRLVHKHAENDPSTARFLAKNYLKMADNPAEKVAERKAEDASSDLTGNESRVQLIERVLKIQEFTVLKKPPNTGRAPGKEVSRRE